MARWSQYGKQKSESFRLKNTLCEPKRRIISQTRWWTTSVFIQAWKVTFLFTEKHQQQIKMHTNSVWASQSSFTRPCNKLYLKNAAIHLQLLTMFDITVWCYLQRRAQPAVLMRPRRVLMGSFLLPISCTGMKYMVFSKHHSFNNSKFQCMLLTFHLKCSWSL